MPMLVLKIELGGLNWDQARKLLRHIKKEINGPVEIEKKPRAGEQQYIYDEQGNMIGKWEVR